MRLYSRQQVEESLITHYRVGGSKDAQTLRKDIFLGVPGHYIGVVTVHLHPLLLGIVFFAEATHPDEPIPHFRNLDENLSKVLNDNLAFLPGKDVICFLSVSEYETLSGRLIENHDVCMVYVIPTAGFVAVTPDRISGTLSNPSLAQEVYNKWAKKHNKMGEL